jgi:hypothetical protein
MYENYTKAKEWLSEELKSSGKVIDDFTYIVSDIRIKRRRKLAILDDTEPCDLNLTIEDVDKILFRYDSKNEELWCNYGDIILIFKSKFGLNWQDIRELCETMLEEHLNCKVVTTKLPLQFLPSPMRKLKM